jgi:hypothetical protein
MRRSAALVSATLEQLNAQQARDQLAAVRKTRFYSWNKCANSPSRLASVGVAIPPVRGTKLHAIGRRKRIARQNLDSLAEFFAQTAFR